MFETPILYLIFNRLELTKITFPSICVLKPKKLFIAADGPRFGNHYDENNCRLVREYVLSTIDWDCEVKVLFREENLGCGKAISEALSWFFMNVDEGIILEDDCLPDISFFSFCTILLNRYRYENRIMHIGGTNLQFGKFRGDGDYYYSIISHVWGWATWRRAWVHYEFNLNNAIKISPNRYNNVFRSNKNIIKYYKDIFSEMRNSKIDTWDYQWFYIIILNNGLSICPNKNLVKNIGFGKEATHCVNEPKWNTLNTANTISSFRQPSKFVIDYDADAYTFQEIIEIKARPGFRNMLSIKFISRKTYSIIKKILKFEFN
jgi:hypothetical protein